MRLPRTISELGSYFHCVIRRFVEEQCLLWAGMLTYSSLLALVPLLVVVLAVVSAFPVFQRWSGRVEVFILQNFVPAAGTVARDYLGEFVARARDLSFVGVAFLIVTALLLMFSIDTVINHIWRVRTRRTFGSKLLVYWAVLTVGPILVSASIVISTNVAPTLQRAVSDPGLREIALGAVPWFVSLLAFSLVYYFVPNIRVPLWHAMAGGLISATLFEGAKSGFGLYLARFPTYEAIYGAFAVVPIFLAWTYLCWVVLLVGACFAAALGSYRRHRTERAVLDDGDLLSVYRTLQLLWSAQRRGEALSLDELLELEPQFDDPWVDRMLRRLEVAGIVRQGEDGHFRLVRDPGELTLLELCRTLPVELPRADDGAERSWETPVRHAFSALHEPLEDNLGQPLERFFEKSASAEKSPDGGSSPGA